MKFKKRIEEKRKLNRKQIIIITIAIIVTAIIIVLFIFKYNELKKKKEREELIANIDKSFSKYVKVKNTSILYNKNAKKIGTIEKNTDFEIIKSKKKTFEYFKIKDTDYYIYYKDVKKVQELNLNDNYTNYITLDKNAITKNKVKFYLDGKLAFTLNKSIEVPIRFINEDDYYVKHLNKVFTIKKEDIKSIKDSNNSSDEETDYISIINYNVLANKCNTDDCVSIKNIEEQINYLNTNGYYSINLEEYKNWLNGNIRLKKKAILLTTPNETEEVKNLNQKYNNILNVFNSNESIKFVDDNNKTTRESKLEQLSRYNVKNNTTFENFQRMVLGDHVEEVKKIYHSQSGGKIAVLNYHFFYDESSEVCGENICLDIKAFKQQLDYLKSNNFKTLTIEEFRAWMYNEMELPEKSVLITIDDGAFGTGRHNGNKLIPILEEYNMHATLFLIAGWWDINNYRSPNLDIQSHTYDMHNTGSCGKAQLICANHDEIVTDLQKSISIIGNTTSFCFPFYTYDEESINAVREVGFKMAFVGGNRKASRSDDKYKIPRYPIYKTTTMERFISMVN